MNEFEGYLLHELGLAKGTVNIYAEEVKRFTVWLEDQGISVVRVNQSELEAYMVNRGEGDRLSPGTVARIISSLRSYFTYLVLIGSREDDPAKKMKPPKKPVRIPKVLSLREIERLLAAIDLSTPGGIRDRALFELVYSCGLRVSEAVDLKLSHILSSEGIIRVHGKGDRERIVPLGDAAEKCLHRYIAEARPKLMKGK